MREDRMDRKFRYERAIERLFNPVVIGARKIGLRSSFATELETIGRTTGSRRVVPVSAKFDATGAWLISQHGTRSGWAKNVTANPEVRIRRGKQWRTGTARFVHSDDVLSRARSFGSNKLTSALSVAAIKQLQTTPISVRVDFTVRDRNGHLLRYGSCCLTEMLAVGRDVPLGW